MSTLKEKLEKALALIEKGWCQYANAKSDAGYPTNPKGPLAAKWCLHGAMYAAGILNADYTTAEDVKQALHEVVTSLKWPNTDNFNGTIVGWNDAPERTQEDVVKRLQDMIAKA